MPSYVLLANFTDQGMRNIKDTISRAEAFQAMAKRSGVTLKELCWTMGRYDVVAVFEAADDESAAALALSASSLGNTTCETLRAFSFDDMKTILGKMV
jgi:uncharacterized protein with GYD domain